MLGECDVLGFLREVRCYISSGLWPVTIQDLGSEVVQRIRPPQVILVEHTFVKYGLCIAARVEGIIFRAPVNAGSKLLKLLKAASLHHPEEVCSTCSHGLACIQACPGVLILAVTQHKLLLWLLTVLAKMLGASMPSRCGQVYFFYYEVLLRRNLHSLSKHSQYNILNQ